MRNHALLMRARFRAGGTALVGLLAGLLTVIGLAAAPPAHAAVTWNDGAIKYSRVINCPSIIWGTPYYENGIGAYAGHAVDADSERPKVGETFYIHVEVFGLGNPCSGTLVQPTFNLPAGVAFDRQAPIQCYVNGGGGNAPNTNCPGWDHLNANGAYYNRNQGEYPSVWPIPQGVEFEIRVPVKASKPLTGANWSVSLWTADGNDSPLLQLPATMWVFPNAPEPQPDPDPDPVDRVDPRLDAWAARTTVPRTKPAVLKASLVPAATGRVTFVSGGKRLCVASISSGRATCQATARLKPGRYRVTASYAGNAKYLADRDAFTFTKRR